MLFQPPKIIKNFGRFESKNCFYIFGSLGIFLQLIFDLELGVIKKLFKWYANKSCIRYSNKIESSTEKNVWWEPKEKIWLLKKKNVKITKLFLVRDQTSSSMIFTLKPFLNVFIPYEKKLYSFSCSFFATRCIIFTIFLYFCALFNNLLDCIFQY